MVTWVTQEMLYNGDDDSAFALDCMESNGFRPMPTCLIFTITVI